MGSGPSSRSLSRIELVVFVAISITGHAALAFKMARARPSEPQLRAQTVSIEMVQPPIEPAKVPPPPDRERPRPVAARHASVRPHFEPPAPVEKPPVSDEPEAPPPPAIEPSPQAAPGPIALPSSAPVIAKAAPVVGAREGANYLKNPRPAYPEIAMRHEWQGEVLLRVRVSPEGKALAISVERSSGQDVLDQAAQEAVREWSFVPARQGGIAIAGWVTVPIVFKLQQGE
jgi:periplasmic protein TonB